MLILLSCNHISTPFAFLLATFLLTHPLRGATNTSDETFNQLVDFYSHTPCGVQRWKKIIVYPVLAFLLTHPSRGATTKSLLCLYLSAFLLTHPSRGATENGTICLEYYRFLLTHPSRGATRPIRNQPLHWSFLLTHPSRGATAVFAPPVLLCGISTHTPLTGCNNEVQSVMLRHKDFYSHTPCGVQLKPLEVLMIQMYFYSHTPCGVQRAVDSYIFRNVLISTHTPLAGCNLEGSAGT